MISDAAVKIFRELFLTLLINKCIFFYIQVNLFVTVQRRIQMQLVVTSLEIRQHLASLCYQVLAENELSFQGYFF